MKNVLKNQVGYDLIGQTILNTCWYGTCRELNFHLFFFFNLPGCGLWDPAGGNGSGQLCQHCGDTGIEVEVQSKDEESKEQAGPPASKLTKAEC